MRAWDHGINNFYTFKLIPIDGTKWIVRLIVLWPDLTAFADEEVLNYSAALHMQRWISETMDQKRTYIAYSTALTLAKQIENRYDLSTTWGRLNREVLLGL